MNSRLCESAKSNIQSICGRVESVVDLTGGINSRVYRVTGSGSIIVKYYADSSRGKCEVDFLNACASCNIGRVPRVIVCDRKYHWSICTDLGGSTPNQVGREEIDSALDMQAELQRKSLEIERFMPASFSAKEGCDSNLSHHRVLLKRLDALRRSSWSQKFQSTVALIERRGIEEAEKFQRACEGGRVPRNIDRWPSQSDVGVHNMLRDPNNDYHMFVDFEYAGWDDKAKFFIDWMLRPGSVMSAELSKYMLKKAYELDLISTEQQKRIVALMGLYICKWSIIRTNYLTRSMACGPETNESLETDIAEYQDRTFKIQAELGRNFL